MSKKKNTLKDLDEFLKQQAATLVSPARLNEETDNTVSTARETSPKNEKTVSTASIVTDLHELASIKGDSFKPELYDILLDVLSKTNDYSAEDKMLINTLLYLKHGDDWKNAIRSFWKNTK